MGALAAEGPPSADQPIDGASTRSRGWETRRATAPESCYDAQGPKSRRSRGRAVGRRGACRSRWRGDLTDHASTAILTTPASFVTPSLHPATITAAT